MACTILVAVKDLLFGSKIQEAAKRSGTEVSWASRFERLSETAAKVRPDTIIADLAQPGLLDELLLVKEKLPEARLIGYIGHGEVGVIRAARSAGLDEVLTRGQFAAGIESILVRERDRAPSDDVS